MTAPGWVSLSTYHGACTQINGLNDVSGMVLHLARDIADEPFVRGDAQHAKAMLDGMVGSTAAFELARLWVEWREADEHASVAEYQGGEPSWQPGPLTVAAQDRADVLYMAINAALAVAA